MKIDLDEIDRVARWAVPLKTGPYVGICLGGEGRECEIGQVIIKGPELRELVRLARLGLVLADRLRRKESK